MITPILCGLRPPRVSTNFRTQSVVRKGPSGRFSSRVAVMKAAFGTKGLLCLVLLLAVADASMVSPLVPFSSRLLLCVPEPPPARIRQRPTSFRVEEAMRTMRCCPSDIHKHGNVRYPSLLSEHVWEFESAAIMRQCWFAALKATRKRWPRNMCARASFSPACSEQVSLACPKRQRCCLQLKRQPASPGDGRGRGCDAAVS